MRVFVAQAAWLEKKRTTFSGETATTRGASSFASAKAGRWMRERGRTDRSDWSGKFRHLQNFRRNGVTDQSINIKP